MTSFLLLFQMGAAHTGFATMQSSILLIASPAKLHGRMGGVQQIAVGAGQMGSVEIGAIATVLTVPMALVLNAIGGIAILLQSLSDNKNRTVADIRSTFTKGGGNLAESGSVAWQFISRGLLLVSAENIDIDNDEISLLAIDAGAEDIEEDAGVMNIYCLPENLEMIRRKLVDAGVEIKSAELIMFPSNTIDLDSKTAMSVLRLLDKLEELDDVQKVFSNANFSDDILNEYSNSN